MECCGKSIVCGVRAQSEHLEQRAVPFRPVLECEMPGRSGFWALFLSAGRPPQYAADLPSRGRSAKRDEGLRIWKRSGSARACFPVLSESCLNQTARRGCLILTRAEEEDGNYGTEEETPEAELANLEPPVIVKKSASLTSPDFLLQVAIFVLTAGFIDAGFSGDWSRIGALSKQTEEELQIAAFGVVPLAITLIWSISERKKQL